MNFDNINIIYINFLEFTKNNPVFSGIIGLWGIGVITFFFRYIPVKIFKIVKRQLTTTLVINNNDEIYYDFLHWISTTNLRSFVRTLNINNGSVWGTGNANISVGYGINIFFFNKRVFFINRIQLEANNTVRSKEQIIITFVGRNHKIFINLLNAIKHIRIDKSKTDIMVFRDGYWRTQARQFKRDLSTVVIKKCTQDKIINHIDKFNSSRDWYVQHGIPYRTGILLKGPPGTGKTSLIKALCSKYDKPLYMLNVISISDQELLEALSSIPEGSIIAIEDIDVVSFNRDISDKDEDDKVIKQITLSGLLNALDGAASNENRILIATTNHPDKLDPALIRDGRFDIKEDIGYMTNETFRRYLKRFYPKSNFKDWDVKPNIPACMAQKIIFDNLHNLEKVLNELATTNYNKL